MLAFLILCSLFAQDAIKPIWVMTPGVIERGIVLPQGKAFRLSAKDCQVDPLAYWPDGSIKHACLTTIYEPSDPKRPTVRPVAPADTVTVDFLIAGSPTRVTFRFTDGTLFRDGPIVQARRSAALVNGFILLTCDLYSYAGGGQSFRVTCEHTYNRSDVPRFVDYQVTIWHGSTQIMERTKRHFANTGWSRRFYRDCEPGFAVLDLEPFHACGAIPRFSPTVASVPPKQTLSHPAWDILGRGAVPKSDMTDHGGRNDMAFMPDWTARWIAHQTPELWAYMLQAADQSFSWPVHIRTPQGEIVRTDVSPSFWFNTNEPGRGDTYKIPLGYKGAPAIPAPYSTLEGYPKVGDVNHQPSLVFVSWLVTCDPYYADQLESWASYTLIQNWPGPANVYRKDNPLGDLEVRGYAYGLRKLVHAAVWLPDYKPSKSYFRGKTVEILQAFDRTSQAHQSPLGSIFEGGPDFDKTQWTIKEFQDGLLAWAIDYAHQNGFQGGEHMRDRLLGFITNVATNPDWLEGDPRRSAMYLMKVGDRLTNPDGTKYTKWFHTWAEAAAGNKVALVKGENRPDGFFSRDWLAGGDYAGAIRGGLLVAAGKGIPGTKEAADWLFENASGIGDGWKVQP